MLVISELLPKIQELQSTLNPANANGAVVDLIKSTNLEHILPKPGPLSSRRFVVSTPAYVNARLVLTVGAVVGRIHRLADVSHLGRDLRARDEPVGYLELDQCATVLRQARGDAVTAYHRDRVQRCWRASEQDSVVAVRCH